LRSDDIERGRRALCFSIRIERRMDKRGEIEDEGLGVLSYV
jgi:hypothetical protein